MFAQETLRSSEAMTTKKQNAAHDAETSKGVKLRVRKRSSVIKDFERVAGPLRGRNQDRKPKA